MDNAIVATRNGYGETEAISRLPSELAVMKMENENIMSLSAARPRDERRMKADLQATFDAYPNLASEMIYHKPVGKGDDGQMKFATGLSIRAAELLAEIYGYNRIDADVIPIDENNVKIKAYFFDYQRGRIWSDSSILSRWYTSKNKQQVRHQDDRFNDLVVKSAKSKMIREVVVRSVGVGLRAELKEIAERKCTEILDPKGVDLIVAKFDGLGVKLPQLESVVGKTRVKGWTVQDKQLLAGIWIAIRDKETTIEEVFAPKGDAAAESSKQRGAEIAAKLDAPKATEPAATQEKPAHKKKESPKKLVAGQLLADLQAVAARVPAETLAACLESYKVARVEELQDFHGEDVLDWLRHRDQRQPGDEQE